MKNESHIKKKLRRLQISDTYKIAFSFMLFFFQRSAYYQLQ